MKVSDDHRILAAAALVLAALLAGCGKTNTALIPGDRASALQDTVNQVRAEYHELLSSVQAVRKIAQGQTET